MITSEQIRKLREQNGLGTEQTQTTTVSPHEERMKRLQDIANQAKQKEFVSSQKDPAYFEEVGKNVKSGGFLEKAGSISKTLAPKSVEGFGQTIGGALATGSKEVKQAQESQVKLDEMSKKLIEQIKSERAKGHDTSRLENQLKRNQGQDFDIATVIPETQKTTKQIAAEGLGTLGTVMLGAKPSSSALGRIGQAADYGFGAGIKKGLEEDKGFVDTTKEGIKGAGIGAATGLVFEGIGAGLKKLGGSLGKNTYNKELQPDTKDLTASIKRNAETFGEQVRNAVDENGKPIYQGTYKTMMGQAQKEIKTNGMKLKTALEQADKLSPVTITRQQAAGDIISSLQDEYGTLTKNQIKTVQEFVKKMPTKMSRTEALDAKRMYDNLMSQTDWNKIGQDSQATFAANVKYALRSNLRKIIEDTTQSAEVRALNQSMGMGMEVKDLAARQIAQRAKSKLSGNILTRAIGRIWDDVLFNPALTTRGSQLTKNISNSTGQTIIGQAAKFGTIEGLTK